VERLVQGGRAPKPRVTGFEAGERP